MGQVARALHDAALYKHSVRIRSPRPNFLQAEDIAAQYLEFGPVERAVEWLTRSQDPSDRHARERLDLLAKAYEKPGNTGKAYRHAKRYVDALSALDETAGSYSDLASHAEYMADLRTQHGRKYSFWQLVDGSAR